MALQRDLGLQACITSLVVVALLTCPTVATAELYKYVNEDGVTVLDSHVPARYVKNGYTILSLDGRVLEVVPRALTEDEIEERDQLLATQRAREERERRRKQADQNLLRLYGSEEDVIRARDTKLASIDSFIETSNSNVERLLDQKHAIESMLADIERAGGQVAPASIDRIRSIDNRIAQIESEIRDKQQEKRNLRRSYAADLKRVRELYGEESGSAGT